MTKNKNVTNSLLSKKPQEPVPPFDYTVQEVTYKNEDDGITIAGTLTLPKKVQKPPVVLLISGMGPNDRDYTMLGHKPFLVLADHLTRSGIAVLRVDKRGVGKSTGVFDATVTSIELSRDVQWGVRYLENRNDINTNVIGLIGHSEGGMIAFKTAAENSNISFLVSLAGVATTDIDDVLKQVSLQLKADGVTDQLVKADCIIRQKLLAVVCNEPDNNRAMEQMQSAVQQYFNELDLDLKKKSETIFFAIKESGIDTVLSFFNSPSYRYWLQSKPATWLENITIPVLALNGNRDYITASKIQLPLIRQSLKSIEKSSVLEIKGANHWFQARKTGAMHEYGQSEETISLVVLKQISDWIMLQV